MLPRPAGGTYQEREMEEGYCRDLPKSDMLAHMLDMPSVRESILRPGNQSLWSPALFHDKIGDSLANVEATLGQVVGVQQTVQCRHCEQRRGPFLHCVRMSTGDGHCANCHWSGQRGRCSFDGAPPVPNPSRVRRPRLTNEEYREHQETVRAIRERKGELVGFQRERQRALLDLRRHISR